MILEANKMPTKKRHYDIFRILLLLLKEWQLILSTSMWHFMLHVQIKKETVAILT